MITKPPHESQAELLYNAMVQKRHERAKREWFYRCYCSAPSGSCTTRLAGSLAFAEAGGYPNEAPGGYPLAAGDGAYPLAVLTGDSYPDGRSHTFCLGDACTTEDGGLTPGAGALKSVCVCCHGAACRGLVAGCLSTSLTGGTGEPLRRDGGNESAAVLVVPLAGADLCCFGETAGCNAARGRFGDGPRKSRDESSGRAAAATGGRDGAGGDGAGAFAASSALTLARSDSSRACLSIASAAFRLAISVSPKSRSSSTSSIEPADAATSRSRTYESASRASRVPDWSASGRFASSASNTSTAQPTLCPSRFCNARTSVTSFSISYLVFGSHGGRSGPEDEVGSPDIIEGFLRWIAEKSVAEDPVEVENVLRSAADDIEGVRVSVPAISGRLRRISETVLKRYRLIPRLSPVSYIRLAMLPGVGSAPTYDAAAAAAAAGDCGMAATLGGAAILGDLGRCKRSFGRGVVLVSRLPRRRRIFGESGAGTVVGIPSKFQFSPTTEAPVPGVALERSVIACRNRMSVCENLMGEVGDVGAGAEG